MSGPEISPAIERMDQLALIVGVCGFVSMVVGVACISGAMALIVAGIGMMGWSFLMARAIALAKRGQNPQRKSPDTSD
jgi:hypothetical protein